MEHIDVSLVGPVVRDDLVLVHAGAAIAVLPAFPDHAGRESPLLRSRSVARTGGEQ
jgi:hydrogenase maturation factor